MSRLIALAWELGPRLLADLIEAIAGTGTKTERTERLRVRLTEEAARRVYRRNP